MKPETALRAFFAVLAVIAISLVTFAVVQGRGGGESDQISLEDAIACDYGDQIACLRHYAAMADFYKNASPESLARIREATGQ